MKAEFVDGRGPSTGAGTRETGHNKGVTAPSHFTPHALLHFKLGTTVSLFQINTVHCSWCCGPMFSPQLRKNGTFAVRKLHRRVAAIRMAEIEDGRGLV